MKRAITLLAVVILPLAARAQTALGIEFVTVGDAENPPDPLTGGIYGGVNYRYRIGKYEVTNQQYAQFLNVVDPLGGNLKNLYDSQMGLDRGGIDFDAASPFGQKYEPRAGKENHPLNYVFAYSAIRFINWLNGGDTENGAYALTGLQSPSLPTLTRQPGATYWMPSLNEWYKAAYYQGPGSEIFPIYGTDYSLYPMGGFIANRNGPPGDDNSANYDGQGTSNPRPRAVGSYVNAPSHYGTFDQGGNLGEWYEGSFERTLGGGFLNSGAEELDSIAPRSNFLRNTGPAWEVGFRIAALPEFPDTDGDGLKDPYETNTGIFLSSDDTGTDPSDPDTDDDGLLDGIEVKVHGTDPNKADTDADGFTDSFEISTGFDPLSNTSTPDLLSTIRTAVEVRFSAATGETFRVEASPDTANWVVIEDGIAGTGAEISRLYSTEETPFKAYRVRRN